MKNNYTFKINKIFLLLSILFLTFTSCEDFLEEDPSIGLSADKLTDIASMNALVHGAYDNMRGFYAYQPMITAGFVRDYSVRNSANWTPFYKWTNTGVPGMFTGNSYSNGFRTLNKVNTVLNADIENMYGTAAQRSQVLGDAHFIRAAIYFQFHMTFTNPTTQKSVPLVTTVLGTNAIVTQATGSELIAQFEYDIEEARKHFAISNGVNTHVAATAMAARMYFYLGKYDLAYARANEVIASGAHSLEANVADIYSRGNASAESIYTIITNRTENSFGVQSIMNNNFQADKDSGVASLNPYSLIAQFRNANPSDKRFADLMTEGDGLVYVDKKYPSLESDYVVLRLAEMYLTRAESNIMKNGSVSASDVADVNMIKNRASVALISGTPSQADMLDIIYNERSIELCFEWGDRFYNTRRLQKDIVAEGGNGVIPYSTYNTLLVYPMPTSDSDIHGF
tara:strand:- start:5037 stop:6398 length:1362 start_codon:yes stop_codon:yes gene_type:complete